jgi:flagella basal body P-ring formation protein FlgA
VQWQTGSLPSGWSQSNSPSGNNSQTVTCTLSFSSVSAASTASFFDASAKCVSPDSLVELSGNTLVAVDTLVKGDSILTQEGETLVTSIIKNHTRDHYYIINNELKITNDHPMFKLDGTTVTPENIKIGDKLKNSTVTSVEKVFEELNSVYIETENGILDIVSPTTIYTLKGGY